MTQKVLLAGPEESLLFKLSRLLVQEGLQTRLAVKRHARAPGIWEELLGGVDALFLVAESSADEDWLLALLQVASRFELKRVLMVSGIGDGDQDGGGLSRVESFIQEMGVDHCFLRSDWNTCQERNDFRTRTRDWVVAAGLDDGEILRLSEAFDLFKEDCDFIAHLGVKILVASMFNNQRVYLVGGRLYSLEAYRFQKDKRANQVDSDVTITDDSSRNAMREAGLADDRMDMLLWIMEVRRRCRFQEKVDWDKEVNWLDENELNLPVR